MIAIRYINRESGKLEEEKVYGERALYFLYGKKSWLGTILCKILAHFTFFSHFYGFLQKRPSSKKKIVPFIEKYHLDPNEFLEPVSSFATFNDFFIRKLKPQARPIAKGIDIAIIPADGRYLFYQHIENCDGFIVKDKKFTLDQLIKDKALSASFVNGSMIIARLCPLDYHRFHFPCDCLPGKTVHVNGPLYSVNPIAIKQNIAILAENKRACTLLKTKERGNILYMEVGATSVGSIHQTYQPNRFTLKGAEKGYFCFGGSTLILLFEEGRLEIDQDLICASKEHIEIYCKMGQSMGRLH